MAPRKKYFIKTVKHLYYAGFDQHGCPLFKGFHHPLVKAFPTQDGARAALLTIEQAGFGSSIQAAKILKLAPPAAPTPA